MDVNKTTDYSSNRYYGFWEDYGDSKELFKDTDYHIKETTYRVRKQTKNRH